MLKMYMIQMMKDKLSVELFLDKKRCRSGKIKAPNENVIKYALEAYYRGDIRNIHFVPISINYDRIMEGETFPLELSGDEKVKESFFRVINAVKFIRSSFGKVIINFSTPFTLTEFINSQDDIAFNNDP